MTKSVVGPLGQVAEGGVGLLVSDGPILVDSAVGAQSPTVGGGPGFDLLGGPLLLGSGVGPLCQEASGVGPRRPG